MTDKLLTRIEKKLASGQRLDFTDGLSLYASPDILAIGRLADHAMLSRVGPSAFYSINRHINYTNICRIGCQFCGFSRRPADPAAYVMSVTEVVRCAELACRQGATEVHIVGGIHPDLEFHYYLDMIAGLRQRCPHLHIKAFTAVEILDLAAKARKTLAQTLSLLQQAGLDALPGGGAEILDPAYFATVCPHKPAPDQWLQVHRTAHDLGLPTNATMLFGYIENPEHRVNHLLTLRKLQDASLAHAPACFQCFVPLPFVPGPGVPQPKPDTSPAPSDAVPCDNIPSDAFPAGALSELKTIAVSRLLLDNVKCVKAFWPMLGVELAQVALCFGANDLDGTVQDYRIVPQPGQLDNPQSRRLDTPQSGQTEPTALPVDRLRQLIIDAGRVPIQRDGFYRPSKKT